MATPKPSYPKTWDSYLADHGVVVPLEYRLPPRMSHPSKCESCGSREFKEHHGETICSYCRSGACP